MSLSLDKNWGETCDQPFGASTVEVEMPVASYWSLA